MVVVLLQPLPFSPNLFCSTSRYAQLTLCRSKGWWKLTKLNPASLLAYVEEKQIRIKALVKEGKTLDQVKKIFNIEDRPGGMRWMSLVEVIYLELTEKG